MKYLATVILLISCAISQAGIAARMNAVIAAQHEDTNWWSSDVLQSCVAYWRPGITASTEDTVGTNDAILVDDAYISADGFVSDGSSDSIRGYCSGETFPLTLSVWVKVASFFQFGRICQWVSSGGDSVSIIQSVDTARPWVAAGEVTGHASSSQTLTNGWHNLVAVFRAETNVVMYYDGSPAVLAGYPTAIVQGNTPSGAFAFMNRWDRTNDTAGTIDEIAVFSNSLSASEIGAYYTNSYNAEFSMR